MNNDESDPRNCPFQSSEYSQVNLPFSRPIYGCNYLQIQVDFYITVVYRNTLYGGEHFKPLTHRECPDLMSSTSSTCTSMALLRPVIYPKHYTGTYSRLSDTCCFMKLQFMPTD